MGSQTQNKHCMLSIRSVSPRTNPKPVYAKMWWVKKNKTKTNINSFLAMGAVFIFCASTVFIRDMGFCKSWYMCWDVLSTFTLFFLLILAEKNVWYADMTMTMYDIIFHNLLFCDSRKVKFSRGTRIPMDGRYVKL